jgi:hypothetical protein
MSKAVARATAVLMLTGAALRLPHRDQDHGAEARVEALPLVPYRDHAPSPAARRCRSPVTELLLDRLDLVDDSALGGAIAVGRKRDLACASSTPATPSRSGATMASAMRSHQDRSALANQLVSGR